MDPKGRADELSNLLIGAALEVHRCLGPGLLESAYEDCLCRELDLRNIPYRRQVELPLEYKGMTVGCSYRMDLVLDDLVLVELKAVQELEPIHEAQVLTYLKLSGLWLGMLINFNTSLLKNGIRRLVL